MEVVLAVRHPLSAPTWEKPNTVAPSPPPDASPPPPLLHALRTIAPLRMSALAAKIVFDAMVISSMSPLHCDVCNTV
jgi:hypothetical protein